MNTYNIITGDCIEGMQTLADNSVHCCVTSPPYWGLRDYGHDGQIGLESTPEVYVSRMVEVFREVRRVLRDDGTLWLNLGDSYASSQSNNGGYSEKSTLCGFTNPNTKGRQAQTNTIPRKIEHGLKSKDLVGIPWRVAFALQADGWWLRQDIIWHKPNPMPESVRDRCTKAHEYVFLLTKSSKYWYDAEAVSEAMSASTIAAHAGRPTRQMSGNYSDGAVFRNDSGSSTKVNGHGRFNKGYRRNRRSVWTVATKPYSGAHFATMPPDLVEPCIKAGCPEGGTVFDPFTGSGTTGAVALALGRNFIGTELNPNYVELAHQRIASVHPLFHEKT